MVYKSLWRRAKVYGLLGAMTLLLIYFVIWIADNNEVKSTLTKISFRIWNWVTREAWVSSLSSDWGRPELALSIALGSWFWGTLSQGYPILQAIRFYRVVGFSGCPVLHAIRFYRLSQPIRLSHSTGCPIQQAITVIRLSNQFGYPNEQAVRFHKLSYLIGCPTR